MIVAHWVINVESLDINAGGVHYGCYRVPFADGTDRFGSFFCPILRVWYTTGLTYLRDWVTRHIKQPTLDRGHSPHAPRPAQRTIPRCRLDSRFAGTPSRPVLYYERRHYLTGGGVVAGVLCDGSAGGTVDAVASWSVAGILVFLCLPISVSGFAPPTSVGAVDAVAFALHLLVGVVVISLFSVVFALVGGIVGNSIRRRVDFKNSADSPNGGSTPGEPSRGQLARETSSLRSRVVTRDGTGLERAVSIVSVSQLYRGAGNSLVPLSPTVTRDSNT